jgi:NADH-quinone oxidoreductase subunit J
MIATLFFYLFSCIAVASAVMVISARNPVHSVLFLILCFFNAAGLFILLGAEFLAMILVVVYVGAVAVLFLFVVMMLDVDFVELRQGMLSYLPIGGVIGLIVLVELVLVLGSMVIAPGTVTTIAAPTPDTVTNTEAIGQLLYTKYLFFFQTAGRSAPAPQDRRQAPKRCGSSCPWSSHRHGNYQSEVRRRYLT